MKVKKILVSQPKPSSDKSPYYEMADKYGVELVFRPFIKTEGVTAKDFRTQKINIADFSAIIFTSKTAVDNFFRLCEELRVAMPATQKYFCTSETIANYLQKYIVYRKRKVFVGKTGKLIDLIPTIAKHKTEKYLLPVSDINNGEEAALLAEHNIAVQRAVMYRTVANTFGPDEAFDFDMLVFFSPQGIESLFSSFPEFKQGDIAIATFGEATAKSVQDAGLRLDVPAPTPESPSMVAAISAYLAKK
ncbi:MAG: uroporphyrinogen-III synthase [Muribaculaceae bacterium]|nr:uroporphyrinogen-III synthase [Bacteroidales bacterium]MDE6040657.1 uroporphyrinogen-III synthase [Muribaculaceae bacterium]